MSTAKGVAVADRPALSLLHLPGGGCGGCALELDGIPRTAWDALGLRLVSLPRHADLLLVSGCVTRTLLRSVEACWAAMAAPKHLVAVGACALDGGPFRGGDAVGGGYAVAGGIGDRLPAALLIPGCPPAPSAILDGLRALLDAVHGAAGTLTPASTAPAPPRALPPAAPRRPPAGGDSSAG